MWIFTGSPASLGLIERSHKIDDRRHVGVRKVTVKVVAKQLLRGKTGKGLVESRLRRKVASLAEKGVFERNSLSGVLEKYQTEFL